MPWSECLCQPQIHNVEILGFKGNGLVSGAFGRWLGPEGGHKWN